MATSYRTLLLPRWITRMPTRRTDGKDVGAWYVAPEEMTRPITESAGGGLSVVAVAC